MQDDVDEAGEEAGGEEDVEGGAFERLSHFRSLNPWPTGCGGFRDGVTGRNKATLAATLNFAFGAPWP